MDKKKSIQYDPYEFIDLFLNSIYSYPYSLKSKTRSFQWGVIETTSKSTHTSHENPFLALSIHMTLGFNLKESLSNYFLNEKDSQQIISNPTILIINITKHLTKRQTNSPRPALVPEEIDISDFSRNSINCKYQLVGMIRHYVLSSTGGFYTFCCLSKSKSYIEIRDDSVVTIDKSKYFSFQNLHTLFYVTLKHIDDQETPLKDFLFEKAEIESFP